MPNFLRTVMVQNRAEAADRTFQEDLPVNPLSVVFVTLRGDNVAADTNVPAADMLGTVPDIGIQFRGQDIVRGSLADLAVLNAVCFGLTPYGYKQQDAIDEIWTVTVPICLGRQAYDPEECFPAVRRGELRLEMTLDVTLNNANLEELQIETVELLDANPTSFVKYTNGQRTFTTTGQERVRLPIGNPLMGVLLFGTTVPTAAVRTATWEQLRLKIDNVEYGYARTNWDSIFGEMNRRLKGYPDMLAQHIHRFNGAAAAFASTLSNGRDSGVLESYAYLDFDPLMDGSGMLETSGRADVEIQRDAGTADVGRFLPVEIVSVAGAGVTQ